MITNSPSELPERAWRSVFARSLRAMADQDMSFAAAGIAFYVVWALFPTLAVIVMFGAFVVGKEEVVLAVSALRLDVRDSFGSLLISQLGAIAERSRTLSMVAVLAAFAFSIWSGMRGARALMAALNVVYKEEERRSFWHRQGIAPCLCFLGGLFVVGTVTLIVGLSGFKIELPSGIRFAALAALRWLILMAATLLLLSVACRYGPCRRLPRWRWVTWGAAVSATIWVVGSSMLSYYAGHYGGLNPLLGSLGLMVSFLFWCYLTVLVVLLGAQINAQLERHAVDPVAVQPFSTSDQKAV